MEYFLYKRLSTNFKSLLALFADPRNISESEKSSILIATPIKVKV